MLEIPVSFLQPGHTTDQNYYSETGEILLKENVFLSAEILNDLKKKGIKNIYATSSQEDEELSNLINAQMDNQMSDSFNFSPTFFKSQYYDPPVITRLGKEGLIELQKQKICLKLDSLMMEHVKNDLPIGPAFKNSAIMAKSGRTPRYKSSFLANYNDALEKTSKILQSIASGNQVSLELVRSISSFLTNSFLTDRNILFNLSNIKATDGDYLFHHVLNVSIISIIIAAAYGYNETQVNEIGMGALLLDVGMLFIPDEIRFKKSRPTEDEWYEIQKHPILSACLLEKLHGIPDSILMMTYQSHERENGKGYPKQRSSRLIHNYAKIAAIADIYEALSSPRTYREAYQPYKAMESLIKMTRTGLVNGEFVKVLLEYISLFPIGSIVELSNKCIGKVIQSNGSSFSKPSVCILTDENGNILSESEQYIEDLSINTSIQIVKTHHSNQLDQNVMFGF